MLAFVSRSMAAGAAVAASAWLAPLAGQDAKRDAAAAIAVADSSLAAITRGDMIAFTDLMVPEAMVVGTGMRDGQATYRARTRASERSTPLQGKYTERGWSPEARVAGGVAMVWYPYDFYLNDAWSHCGVDVFTLVRHERSWRIASLVYSVEQPPACAKHPKGPPPGAKP